VKAFVGGFLAGIVAPCLVAFMIFVAYVVEHARIDHESAP
jgi:hypothetical protein